MPATVTLSTTTLAEAVGPSDTLLKLASTSGVLPGMRLFLDGELVRVQALGVVAGLVSVIRGDAGTGGSPHVSGVTVYIGEAHQFYQRDPVGRPPAVIPVSPWINVLSGSVWFAQGDALPAATAERWWQKQVTTHDVGALGVRTTTPDITASS